MAEAIKSANNPSYVSNHAPTIANYHKLINTYTKGISTGDFYEEPIGTDFIYPDW